MPLPILNQFIVPCPSLTVASWPAYRFLRIITLSEKRQTRRKKKNYLLYSFIYKTPENKLIYSGRKQLSGGLRLEWSDNISILICFFSHLHPWPFIIPTCSIYSAQQVSGLNVFTRVLSAVNPPPCPTLSSVIFLDSASGWSWSHHLDITFCFHRNLCTYRLSFFISCG